MVTLGRLWIGGFLVLLGLTHFLVWISGRSHQSKTLYVVLAFTGELAYTGEVINSKIKRFR
jgi:hypothetical protein